MKQLRDESGQVMVLTVLCFSVLLGFVAFAVDIGILLYARRTLQTAADSAAIAGASEVSTGIITPAEVDFAAKTDAAQNGVTGGANTTVTVNDGPASGPHFHDPAYVEVLISRNVPTFFMRVFNHDSMTVTARAVATKVPSPTCIFTLQASPGGSGAGIDIENGEQLIAPGCAIVDGASSPNAITVAAGSQISAKLIGAVGGVDNSGTITPAAQTGTVAPTDPLSSLPAPPDPGGCTSLNATSGTIGPATPGGTVCYTNLNISGSGTVTLNPGVYYINGSMHVTSTGTITGNGVTFYFSQTAGTFSDSGLETLSLSAPTDGTYNGILFFQDPSNTTAQMSITPGSAWTLNGIFYLPAAQLYLTGGIGSPTLNISLVVGSFTATGNSSLNLNGYGALTGTSPIYSPRLAE